MGRHRKKVVDCNGDDRREVGYYSTPGFVAEFLVERLTEIEPEGTTVLDPCIGRGEMTSAWKQAGKHVVGFDVTDMKPLNCDEFQHRDFLEYYISQKIEALFCIKPVEADYIVANPPYNCHEVEYIRERKSQLAGFFGRAAALNMYSLFIRAIIDIAKPGAVIGLITHDSFMTARGHEELREFIRTECAIHNIHLCPTNLFLDQGADVRTCILILQKRQKQPERIALTNRPSSVPEFRRMLHHREFLQIAAEEIVLTDSRDKNEFVIGVPNDIKALFAGRRLSEVAPCVTGISTGNDQKYLSPIKTETHSVPFYKNPAKRRFYAGPDAYLLTNFGAEEKLVYNFMVRNKELMFRGGLSCSSMGVQFGAVILPKDAAFGVNPNVIIEDENTKWWLLSYLNSQVCFYMVRNVLIRTNMITAGYAARIPVPEFDETTCLALGALGVQGYERTRNGQSPEAVRREIDMVICSALDLSVESIRTMNAFSADPTRLT